MDNLSSRKMKDSGIEWVGQIPEDWDVIKISGLYSLRNTKVSDKDYPPLSVTMQGILPQLETAAKTNDHDNRKLVKKGDFAINSRSDRRGSCGISDLDGSVSLINTVLKPNKIMNSRYYNWLFHTPQFSDEFYKWGHGIVDDLWTTNWQDMKKITVPYPSIDTQGKIANYLDVKCAEIDTLYADIEKEIETLEEYKKSVITEVVTKGLNPNVEMKDSGVEYIGKTPSAWNTYRLKDVLTERNERSKTGTELLLSVSQYYGVIPSNENKNRTMQAGCLVGYKNVKKNDLIFNKLNPGLARFGYSNYDGITSPDFSVYKVDENVCTAKFLQYLLKIEKYVATFKGIGMGVGDGFARLYTPQLYRFFISIPRIEDVISIVDYLEKKCSEIDDIILSKKNQLDILDNHKKSIIYEYVTGKKEVPN